MKKPGYVKLFDGLNYAGAILTFLAALGAIASTTKLSAERSYLWPLVLIVFTVGQLLIVLATVGLTKIRFTLKNVTALVGLYTLLSCWDLIAMVIGLPFIVITMVLGPLTVSVWILASVILGMYCVEEMLGYDLKGYISILETPFQAGVTLGVWGLALLVLKWHLGKEEGEDWLMEKASDLIFNWRHQLQGLVGEIIQKRDYD